VIPNWAAVFLQTRLEFQKCSEKSAFLTGDFLMVVLKCERSIVLARELLGEGSTVMASCQWDDAKYQSAANSIS
jgi:hypothetical protein